MDPIRKLGQTIQTVMNLGGLAIVARKLAMEIGEMEKAYAKLHPEAQNAAGSLTHWNEAMMKMKAEQGAIVAGVLTPIRKAFLDMIDPIGSATYELQVLQKELQNIAEKYMTTERKQIESLKQAQVDLVRVEKERAKLLEQQPGLQEKLNTAYKNYLDMQAHIKSGGAAGMETEAEQQLEWLRTQSEAAKAALDANKKAVGDSTVAIRNLNEVIAAAKKPTDDGVKGTENLTTALKDQTDQIYLTSEAMAGLYEWLWKVNSFGGGGGASAGGGGKGGSRGKVTKSIGRRQSTWGPSEEDIDNAEEMAAVIEDDLYPNYAKYFGLLVSAAETMGEAFASGDMAGGLRQIAQQLLSMLSTLALEAAASAAVAQNWPMVALWLGVAGVSAFSSGVITGSGAANVRGGVELPHMAAGGIVTRPTLAMIGEAGPEAVVPLGRGGAGGVNIYVNGSIWQTEDLARAVAGAMSKW